MTQPKITRVRQSFKIEHNGLTVIMDANRYDAKIKYIKDGKEKITPFTTHDAKFDPMNALALIDNLLEEVSTSKVAAFLKE